MEGRCAWEGEGWQAGQINPCVIPVHNVISEVIGQEKTLQRVHFTVLFGCQPRSLPTYKLEYYHFTYHAGSCCAPQALQATQITALTLRATTLH
jgi:hypothetical protein